MRSTVQQLGCVMLALFVLAACSPGVTGQVFYDANQNGQLDNGEAAAGMAGVPVELYLVKAAQTKSSAGNTVANTPLAATPAKKVGSAAVNGALLGGHAATSLVKDIRKEETGDKPLVSDDTSNSTPATAPIKQPSSTSAANGSLVASATTDRYGHFEFRGIEPGDYEVRMTDQYGPLSLGYRVTSGRNPLPVSSLMRAAHANLGIYRQGLTAIGQDCPEKITGATTQTCIVTYRNESPVTMEHVAMTAKIPHEVLATPLFDGIFYTGTNEIQWTWPQVAPQSTVQVGFTVVPNLLWASTNQALNIQWRVGSDTQLTEESLTDALQPNMAISVTPTLLLALHTPATVVIGQPFSVELYYQYTQAVAIPLAVVTVTLPEGMSAVKPGDGVWDAAERTIRWDVGTVQPGTKQSRYFQVQMDGHQTSEQSVNLTASLDGMGLAQAVGTTTQIILLPDTKVVLSAQVSSLLLEATADSDQTPTAAWSVQMTQTGNRVIDGAVLVAHYDGGLVIESGGNLDSSARTVTWNLSPLQPGKAQAVTLFAHPYKSPYSGYQSYPVKFSLHIPGVTDPVTQQADLQVHFSE